MSAQGKSESSDFKQFEHDGWADVAASYMDNFAQATLQAVEPMLDAAAVGPDTRVLDVACGPGMNAAAASQRGAEATGLDFVADMIAVAQRRHPGVEFCQGDAENLPFDDGAFDAVICGFGILHFPEPERAIVEAHRVLVSGGRYVFTSWSSPGRSPLMGLIYGAFQAHADLTVPLPTGPAVFQFGEHDACTNALEAAGFSDCQAEELDIVMRFPDVGGVVEMIHKGTARTKGLLARQTDETRRKIETVITQGAQAYQQGDEMVIPMPAVLASGRKEG